MTEFRLSREAFAHCDEIPRCHTFEGEGISPLLSWSDPPAETCAVALIVDDPDAPRGTFTDWLAWNIDPVAGGLGGGRVRHCRGAQRLARWSGPCPPPGHGAHRYSFRLHALDAEVHVAFRAVRPELERAIAGHVLTTAELMDRYGR